MTVSLEQISYDVAYFVLPVYAFERFDRLLELARTPQTLGPFLYIMACHRRGIEPDERLAARYRLHRDDLDEHREYVVVEYPTPKAVDLSSVPLEQLADGLHVLAPHFSAIIRRKDTDSLAYFVLGQAPIGGGTTLRAITPQTNSNLGPGPYPSLANLLEILRSMPSP